MQKIINFFRGSISLEIVGAFPERFLNLCAQGGVQFWGVEWLDEHTLRITVRRSDLAKAKLAGERVMCEVRTLTPRGVPSFMGRFRRRYAFLVGLTLSFLAVCILSNFVLTIDVEGNETVTTAEILSELRRQGLTIGVYGPTVDERLVANGTLLQCSDLAWMSIIIQGTKAQVLVREITPPPEVVDENEYGDIVATASGLITHMEVEKGSTELQEGDIVVEGEVLISGSIQLDPPQYSELEPTWQQVRATGRIYARTWRTLEGEIPLTADVKVPTGEDVVGWYINILGYRVNFYGNSGISFAKYDKISTTWTATLPSGESLPLGVGYETISAYELTTGSIDTQNAQAMLEEQLEETLRAQIGDGEVVSMDFTAEVVGDALHVTLVAECQEEIGKFIPWETGEGIEEMS